MTHCRSGLQQQPCWLGFKDYFMIAAFTVSLTEWNKSLNRKMRPPSFREMVVFFQLESWYRSLPHIKESRALFVLQYFCHVTVSHHVILKGCLAANLPKWKIICLLQWAYNSTHCVSFQQREEKMAVNWQQSNHRDSQTFLPWDSVFNAFTPYTKPLPD